MFNLLTNVNLVPNVLYKMFSQNKIKTKNKNLLKFSKTQIVLEFFFEIFLNSSIFLNSYVSKSWEGKMWGPLVTSDFSFPPFTSYFNFSFYKCPHLSAFHSFIIRIQFQTMVAVNQSLKKKSYWKGREYCFIFHMA